MPGSVRQGNRRRDKDSFDSRPLEKKTRQPGRQPEREKQQIERNAAGNRPKPQPKDEQSETGPIDLSTTVPIPLQQLLLDVFKTALLPNAVEVNPSGKTQEGEGATEATPSQLDTKTLIQTIKSHLYQRDFDSAFAEAGEELLRAYALRWSAARSLGYAGIFKAVLAWMKTEVDANSRARIKSSSPSPSDALRSAAGSATRVVCLGGGAGAEIVALAAAWRDLQDGLDAEGKNSMAALEHGVKKTSLAESDAKKDEDVIEDNNFGQEKTQSVTGQSSTKLSVEAVDIADWTVVMDRLSKTIISPDVPAQKTSKYQPPLLSTGVSADTEIAVSFHRRDVLVLPESELKDLILGTGDQNAVLSSPTSCSSSSSSPPLSTSSLLVTLMFTLNELFSTSMPKTTGLLLKITEILPAGAVLLVVDSPGSYSTLKLGKAKDGEVQERQYPMKFLLDHTLLSVAKGKWERVLTQDSRWWRRNAARLSYEVGEGAGLEDMRYQIHVYRKL
ncbi:hypothetical protein N7539_002391 [Penicillium diatomitis]|uniref:25S rRNA (Uridine(2843)-N(3))-methyltransferase n=1 Tax=Penicillium diatomitis TaxID=2819901 RepID=A0A9W9XEK0_9EURO|nr:uncharacterized protein N7539_002391 [Penicillium diatomitis]KAJ5490824.1 hypothetical protein N7539_002391 [Penicillium diatomitis]